MYLVRETTLNDIKTIQAISNLHFLNKKGTSSLAAAVGKERMVKQYVVESNEESNTIEKLGWKSYCSEIRLEKHLNH